MEHHRKFTLEDRRIISRMIEAKARISEIAEAVQKHRSSVYREIKRNYWHDDEYPIISGYWHMTAQKSAMDRYQRRRKLVRDSALRDAVIDRLKEGWSPEQIAGRLKIEAGPTRICHETIYQFVYSREGQSQELARYLPEHRKKRRHRGSRKSRGSVCPEHLAIKHRPKKINERQEFGHWEADLIIFRREHGNANVATVVERQTRFTVLIRNGDRRSRPIMNRLIDHLGPLPAQARRSVTFDRGFEFVSWRELHKGMGTKAWFCDPKAPWQKGTVENTNKRVRRYLPRDAPIYAISNQSIKLICDRLNATPRKCLGWKTPAEAFRSKLSRELRK